MPRRKATLDTQQHYSPDFKLKVVLEYIRNPRQQKRVCQKYQISEDLMAHWHQDFLERASRVFSEDSTPTPNIQPSKSKDDLASNAITEKRVAQQGPSWGIHLNKDAHNSYQSATNMKEPPVWLHGHQLEDWNNPRVIVIWDNAAQKLHVLDSAGALLLVEKLHENDNWQTEGIAIKRHVWRPKSSDGPERRNSRKKGHQEELITDRTKPEYEHVEEEWFRLKPQASSELFEFLQQHESLLKQMAEEDHKRKVEILARVYSTILSWDVDEK